MYSRGIDKLLKGDKTFDFIYIYSKCNIWFIIFPILWDDRMAINGGGINRKNIVKFGEENGNGVDDKIKQNLNL